MNYLFPPDDIYAIPVNGEETSYPIHRIFCVGKNYAAHAAEMGEDVDRQSPIYFTKTPSAAIASGSEIPYPPGTQNFHYEMEMAIAIGSPAFQIARKDSMSAVYGYCSALDMTRRDLQYKAREKKNPWDLGKDVENSAVFAAITKAEDFRPLDQSIYLKLNGDMKQNASLQELIWNVDEIVSDLSQYYHLRPGDIILTGTPAGVGPVQEGDQVTGGIDGLDPISLKILAAE